MLYRAKSNGPSVLSVLLTTISLYLTVNDVNGLTSWPVKAVQYYNMAIVL